MTERPITTIEVCDMTWVSWDEYRALAAERDELRKRAEEAEVERLRRLVARLEGYGRAAVTAAQAVVDDAEEFRAASHQDEGGKDG